MKISASSRRQIIQQFTIESAKLQKNSKCSSLWPEWRAQDHNSPCLTISTTKQDLEVKGGASPIPLFNSYFMLRGMKRELSWQLHWLLWVSPVRQSCTGGKSKKCTQFMDRLCAAHFSERNIFGHVCSLLLTNA